MLYHAHEIEAIANLKETIRNLSGKDEVMQPSINNGMAQRFVEQEARVVGSRYEMLVPLEECIKTLPNSLNMVLPPSELWPCGKVCFKGPSLEKPYSRSMGIFCLSQMQTYRANQ